VDECYMRMAFRSSKKRQRWTHQILSGCCDCLKLESMDKRSTRGNMGSTLHAEERLLHQQANAFRGNTLYCHIRNPVHIFV